MKTQNQTTIVVQSWLLESPYWSRANAIEALIGYMYRARKQDKKIEFAQRAEKEIIQLESKLNCKIIFGISPVQAIQYRELTRSALLSHQEEY